MAEDFWPNTAVTIPEILARKDARSAAQRAAVQDQGCVVAVKLNVAGPVKTSAALAEFAHVTYLQLRHRLQRCGWQVTEVKTFSGKCGVEVIWQVNAAALAVKRVCVAFEQAHAALRLLDCDVIAKTQTTIKSIKRQEVGASERQCLLCDLPAKECGRNRTHSVAQLQAKTQALVTQYLTAELPAFVADSAVFALLAEVSTPAKPGLVSPLHHECHRDMDQYTFINSAIQLRPYFVAVSRLAQTTTQTDLPQLFARIRPLGIKAEQQMLAATGNVNTHKGAIFALGILAAATVWHWRYPDHTISVIVKKMTTATLSAELKNATGAAPTAGLQQYEQYGTLGARGAALAGYDVVFAVGLPALQAAQGSREERILTTLCALAAKISDSNLIKRAASPASVTWWHNQLAKLTQLGGVTTAEGKALWQDLNAHFARNYWSLGGTADLVIATIFMDQMLGGTLDAMAN